MLEKAAWKLASGALVGFAAIAACAAAAPPPPVPVEPAALAPGDELAKRAEDAGAADAGRCPNGALEDPHRGFVRCLTADERDAGWLPPAPQGDPDAGTDAGPPKAEGTLATAEVGKPTFENGDVPKIEKAFQKSISDVAKCVNDNGGLGSASGSLKVQFLVRPRGRAEGVEVSGHGVSAQALACVRTAFKNRTIGAPTADPTGVTVTFTLKPAK